MDVAVVLATVLMMVMIVDVSIITSLPVSRSLDAVAHA